MGLEAMLLLLLLLAAEELLCSAAGSQAGRGPTESAAAAAADCLAGATCSRKGEALEAGARERPKEALELAGARAAPG